MFWFRKNTQNSQSKSLLYFFGAILLIFFLIFSWIYKLKLLGNSSVSDKASIAQKLARGVDQEIGNLIASASTLYQIIQSGWAILDYQKEIDTLFSTIGTNKKIKSYIPAKFTGLYEIGQQWIPYKDDLIDLLGPDRVRTYLVALMNSSEIRPNGGFFGSYAIVQVYKGKLVQYKVYDSYYAYHQNSGVRLILDPDSQKLIGQQSVNFISPNVFGFTNIDGENIKKLYEQLFPGQLLDGVITVKSEFIEQLLPSLKSKIIERQFVNASIDLIRWQALPNKKEKYLEDMGQFLENNKDELFAALIQNIPYVLESNSIHLYLPKSTVAFQDFLQSQSLNTAQEPEKLYMRHINKSFNKIDKFVTKKFVFQDKEGRALAETNDQIMSFDEQWNNPDKLRTSLKNGEIYELYFFYTLNVSQSYIDQIFGLTKQYDIEITQREQHILGLSFNRHNQVIVHLPNFLEFQSLEWDLFCKNQDTKNNQKDQTCYTIVDWKFSQTIGFDVLGFGNNSFKVVRMKVKKL